MDFILSAEDNMVFNVTPPVDEIAAPTVLFQLPDSTKIGTLKWSVVCNETTFAGLGPSGFFLQDSQADNAAGAKALKGLADGVNIDGQQAGSKYFIKNDLWVNFRYTQISFLTYQTKSLAGGWRFLTYFGRVSVL